MEKNAFKRTLIFKLALGAAFLVLTIGAAIGINVVNKEVIAPNEGFITNALCKVETGGMKNNMGERLAVEIEQEGIVLAKNDDNVLPLAKDNKNINIFGFNSVDWYISNSGSGSASAGTGQKSWGLLEALDAKGVNYNKDLINYYKSWAGALDKGVSYSNDYENTYRLTNPSLSNNPDYKAIYDGALGKTDTAFVVIGRYGGEHLDPPHQQINNYKSKKVQNPERGYLELTEEEEELLMAVGKDYDKVLVIINSTNVMQMDFMTEIEGLDACLIVGPTGTVGAQAIPQIIWGEINPSGRTADTWPMDHRFNPAYYTSGYWPDTVNGTIKTQKASFGDDQHYWSFQEGSYYTGAPSRADLANSNQETGTGYCYFADYLEGIYVGYKWYETAYAEGFWNKDPYNGYQNVVAYPFGFGLSYTKFDWELVSKTGSLSENSDIIVQVRVTNSGTVAGRDVVEIYLDAEYHPGQIEKAAVRLVGFQKTKNLIPGDSDLVTITLHARDFYSFDSEDYNGNGHAGYELDKGTYEFKLMTDAHNMKEGVVGGNSFKYTLADTIDIDVDEVSGHEVKPLFTGDNAIDGVSMDGKSIGENIEYLHRDNFAPLLTELNPCRPWNNGLITCDDSSKPTAYSTQMAKDWDNATEDVFGNPTPTTAPTFGKNNSLKVLDERNQLTPLGKILAADYNAPEWDDLLDQLDWSEGERVFEGQSYHRPGFKSLGLKQGYSSSNGGDYNDAEGACQVAGTYDNGKRNTAYPDPCLQAQTWNETMLYSFGLSESKDMAITGNDYLYGPASNIRRSPYGGRHAEYHSEDGFLAARCLSNVTQGLADGGKGGFIKHFALNDTEFHRVGLITWCTEQALREIYLKPFEEAVKRGEAVAVMSSFNRIGAIWTGGSQALCQGVLRNEWGFNGMMITDYTENGTLQDTNQMLRAGGNFVLASSNYNNTSLSNATLRLQWRVRESAKQVVYGSIRPLHVNAVYNSDTSHKAITATSGKSPWVWWKPLLHGVEAFVIVGFAFGTVAALFPSNPEFRAHLFGKKKEEPDSGAKNE